MDALRIEPTAPGDASLDVAILVDHSGSMQEACARDRPGRSKHEVTVGALERVACTVEKSDMVDLWEFEDVLTFVGSTRAGENCRWANGRIKPKDSCHKAYNFFGTKSEKGRPRFFPRGPRDVTGSRWSDSRRARGWSRLASRSRSVGSRDVAGGRGSKAGPGRHRKGATWTSPSVGKRITSTRSGIARWPPRPAVRRDHAS
jgi:hypothetical protein